MKGLILAAGRGTRFKSSKPKVLHEILSKPIIYYVISSLKEASITDIGVVVSYKKEDIIKALEKENLLFYTQENPAGGTADAFLAAKEFWWNIEDYVLVVNGDSPLIKSETIKGIQRFIHMVQEYENKTLAAVVLSSFLADPSGYGRIIRDKEGNLLKIVEEKDANFEEKRVNEVNGGLYVFYVPYIKKVLDKLKPSENTKELYITDIPNLLVQDGYLVRPFISSESSEIIGVNNRWELSVAEGILRLRILEELGKRGVTLHSPESIWIEQDVQIKLNAEIFGGTFIRGNSIIEENVKIMNNVYIENSHIEKNAVIMPFSVIRNSHIKEGAIIGPFAHIRDGSVIGASSHIGNFVEIKNSSVGENVNAKHLSYIGDANLEKNVNIGAGTITANFDGKNKHKTHIKEGAFVGSNSLIIAPCIVGKEAFIAGGSVITKDIPDKALAIERSELKIYPNKSKVKKDEA